jgi:hypothetical protein
MVWERDADDGRGKGGPAWLSGAGATRRLRSRPYERVPEPRAGNRWVVNELLGSLANLLCTLTDTISRDGC